MLQNISYANFLGTLLTSSVRLLTNWVEAARSLNFHATRPMWIFLTRTGAAAGGETKYLLGRKCKIIFNITSSGKPFCLDIASQRRLTRIWRGREERRACVLFLHLTKIGLVEELSALQNAMILSKHAHNLKMYPQTTLVKSIM